MVQHKRRKLSYSSSSILTPLTTNCPDVQPPFWSNATLPNGLPSKPGSRITSTLCRTCHRASIRPLLACQRCASPTCTICSRTCHPPPAAPLADPALQFSGSNKSLQVHQPVGAKAKRTHADAEGDPDSYSDTRERGGDWKGRDRHETRGDATSCARTTCRACCVEDARTGLVQCLDCYSRVSKLPAGVPDPELSPLPMSLTPLDQP